MLVEWANNRNIGLTDGSRWFVQPSGYLIMDWEYILPKCIASCSTSADPWWNSVRMNHGYAGLHVRIGHVICPVHHGRVVMATRFSVFKIPRAPMPCMRCTPPPQKKKLPWIPDAERPLNPSAFGSISPPQSLEDSLPPVYPYLIIKLGTRA